MKSSFDFVSINAATMLQPTYCTSFSSGIYLLRKNIRNCISFIYGFVCLFFLFISLKASASDPSIKSVRELYQQAAAKEEFCKKLLTILEPYSEKNNVLLAGYKGCATMLKAKYNFNPFAKLSNFIKGKNLLEKSIEMDKNNIELRFLRFAVQTNTPSFLGYKSAIKDDKIFLLNYYHNITDAQLKHWLISFLKTSTSLTAKEKQNIKE